MFANRQSAGRRLGRRLRRLRRERPVVLALPRGGVAVGFEVAELLDAPLDIVLVRKIGAPGQPELALGAVADGGGPQIVVSDRMAAELGVDRTYIEAETARQLAEIERRREVYVGSRQRLPLAGRTAIVVDDGIATGSTVRAALRAVRSAGAAKTVLAVPVAPRDTLAALREEADEIVCLDSPTPFVAVGAHYADFAQLSDAEVVALLEQSRRRVLSGAEPAPSRRAPAR
jgi:putative phosphoribosyl transferase